jgi:hypothetical protein
VDLLVLLNSFCPAGSSVVSVTVYPSRFGLERMAQEASGPPQEIWGDDENTKKKKKSKEHSKGDTDAFTKLKVRPSN